MRLLDLFCGAGGAGMGYHRAGFEVVGVDINPQPHYPFEFHQADALEYLAAHGQEFDAIHASPPCQRYSVLAHLARKSHKAMIPQVRKALIEIMKPFVIENVPGAPLHNPIQLCGTSFGLIASNGAQLRRHRLFETNFPVGIIPPCAHNKNGATIGIFGDKARDTGEEKRHYSKPKQTRGRPPETILFTHEDAGQAMGIDWMNIHELSQAIPPDYTEFIGRQLMQFLGAQP
jgi:DNA (cytosine-5)-methyltransferase 1